MLRLLVLACAVLVIAGQPVPGGWSDAEVDDQNVLDAAGHAAKTLSQMTNSRFHHKLAKIVKAEQQVVAGMNYKMDLVVGETECSKNDVSYDGVEECEFKNEENTFRKCTVVVYRDLEGNHHLTDFKCSVASRNEV